MATILGETVRDAGFVGGKISWKTVENENGKRLQNEFLVLQKHKSGYNPVGALSLMTRGNKTYRILLNNTAEVLKSSGNVGNNLIGKTLIVAESDDKDDIISAWEILDSLLFPILATIYQSREDRRLSWNDFIDMLQSIEDKRRKRKKQTKMTLSASKSSTDSISTISTPAINAAPRPKTPTTGDSANSFTKSIETVSIQQPTAEHNKGTPSDQKPTPTTTTTTTTESKVEQPAPKPPPTFIPVKKVQQQIIVTNLDQASEAVAEYSQQLRLLCDNIKRLSLAKDKQKILGTLESLLERTKHISGELDKFFLKQLGEQPKKGAPKQPQSEQFPLISKLNVQYQELKQNMSTQVLANENIKQLEIKRKQLQEEKQKRDAEERRRKLLLEYEADSAINAEEPSTQPSELQQQLMTKDKIHISKAAIQTVQVEQSIANETVQDLRKLEVDMNELYSIHQDLNELIKYQGASLQSIHNNLDDASQDIETGNENIKSARNLRTFGF